MKVGDLVEFKASVLWGIFEVIGISDRFYEFKPLATNKVLEKSWVINFGYDHKYTWPKLNGTDCFRLLTIAELEHKILESI